MAKTSKTAGETPGPTVAIGGFSASVLPRNPSDEIMEGKALPLIPAQGLVERRPFSLTTRTPLHYNDGPGVDECVTSRRTRPPLETLLEGNIDHRDLAEHFFGEDQNKYSHGPDEEYTLGGAWIRGT